MRWADAHEGPPSCSSFAGMNPSSVLAARDGRTGTFILDKVDVTAEFQSTFLWPPRIAALCTVG